MRILFVDNHPEFTGTVIATFLHAHEVVVVPTIVEARTALERSTFDVVLVDYDLDDGKGDELVHWIRRTRGELRLVAVSARSEGNASLVAAGAHAACPKMGFAQIESVLGTVIGDRTAPLRPGSEPTSKS